jgi:hypothetical protein
VKAFHHVMGSCRNAATAPLFLALLMLPILAWAQAQAQVTLKNAGISVTVNCSGGAITLTHITSVVNGTDYLSGATPLLSFSVNDFDAKTNYYNGSFSKLSCNLTGDTIAITANSSDNLVAFSITISPDGTNPVVIVSTQVTYQGAAGSAATAFFRAILPNIQTFNVPNSGAGKAMAMVPQMIGGLLPLSQVGTAASDGLGASYGFGNDAVKPSTFGLPTSLNVMELAEVYDGSSSNGGGLFFTDLDGDYSKNIAPLQFELTNTSSTSATSYQIAGYWTALLKLDQTVTLPRLAIGVHPSGDWHNAIAYYVGKRSGAWTFPDTPTWLRAAGAIYELGVAGGGSFLDTFPTTAIDDRYLGIQSFKCSGPLLPPLSSAPGNEPGNRCLVDVYNDAHLLGSNVIYLTSWWDHPSNCSSLSTSTDRKNCLADFYGNKGDWIVRADFGGTSGLSEGVAQVHKVGGKVILYIEAYIAADSSVLVSSGPGNSWQARPGPPIPTSDTATDICMYSTGSECMAIPNTQWQDYLINRAVSLMTATGVDGFYLDSWGWQMNWPVETSAENANYTSQQWTAAALRFVDRFRAAIRAIKSDAILMGENNAGQLPFHWDGGSAADLSYWNGNNGAFNQDAGLLLASPIRSAMPSANFFVNGSGLSGSVNSIGVNGSALSSVNQVIAAGHNLALGPFFLLNVMSVGTVTAGASNVTPKYTATPPYCPGVSKYIQSLVQLRSANLSTQDALVYGSQLPMPTTNSSDIVAFMYQGQTNQVLAIVNNGSSAISSATVKLDPSLGTGNWTSIVPASSTPITEASDGTVTLLTISPAPSAADKCDAEAMGGLVILFRESCPGGGSCTPQIYGVTQEAPLMNESFSAGLGNWTDWTASGGKAVASGRWSTSPRTLITPASLVVQSPHDLSLLFYDSFGGGDFTYSGGITFDSLPVFGLGGAGLSFRLSDRPEHLDAGNTGYDVVLTSQPFYSVPIPGLPHIFPPEGPLPVPPPSPDPGPLLISNPASGSVQVLKGPTGKILAIAPLNITAGHFYQLSITAKTNWTTSLPSFPSSTTFTVYIDGAKTLSVTDSDSPYFSGRFGVNASHVNAHFTCLQANDGPLPPACPDPLSFNPPGPLPVPH